MSDPHLLVAISGHGLGHLSQASAVINALTKRVSHLQLTIRSPLATSVLEQWITPPFTHHRFEDDIGMRMTSALDVDVPASEAAYAALHNHWDAKVAGLAKWLQQQQVTQVLADIAYLPLAAAQFAGIPNVAMCSLNWAEVMACYLQGDCAKHWQAQAMQAYQQADAFIQPAPSMPMAWLNNRYPIAPIGRVGRNQRGTLDANLKLPADSYAVLVGMGGMALSLSVAHWPSEVHGKPIHYLLPDALRIEMKAGVDNLHAVSAAEMAYHDIMASVDLMLTKPGYGTFVEAAATGLPVIYISRDDWPDAQSLVQWLHQVGFAAQISREALALGEFSSEMERLLQHQRYPATFPEGDEQAARYLKYMLDF